MNLQTLNARIAAVSAKHDKILGGLKEERRGAIKRYIISCVHCAKKSTLGKWGFVQDYWYTPPSGCSDGDYWNSSEANLCHIACPSCRHTNYLYNHPQRDAILGRIKDGDKKDLFAEVWTQYGDAKLKRIFPADNS